MRGVATVFLPPPPPKKSKISWESGRKCPAIEGIWAELGCRAARPRPEFANQAASSSACAGSREGAAEPSSRARQQAVSNSKTLRFCCRAVATTLSIRSTNRLSRRCSCAKAPHDEALARRRCSSARSLQPRRRSTAMILASAVCGTCPPSSCRNTPPRVSTALAWRAVGDRRTSGTMIAQGCRRGLDATSERVGQRVPRVTCRSRCHHSPGRSLLESRAASAPSTTGDV